MDLQVLAAAVIPRLASEIYKDLKKTINSACEHLLDQFEADLERYLKSRSERNARVKTLVHNSDPVDFYQIYEPLSVTTSALYNKVIFEVEDLFKTSNYITVFGSAGCGKTTLLRHLAFSCVSSKFGIPVTIHLREIEKSDFTIIDLICGELHFKARESLVELLLKQGKIILFLDGFDELRSETKRRLISELRHLMKHFQDTRIILSSRPGSGIRLIDNFVNVEVNPFSEEQALSFVARQLFKREPKSREKILDLCKEGLSRNEIREYLKNPLLLNIFLVTMDHKHEIPENIQDFYQRVIDALFFKHDQDSKPDFNREFKTKLTNNQLLLFLKKFSFVTHLNSIYSFGPSEVDTYSKASEESFGDKYSRSDLIYDLEVSVSLWTENNGHYEYAHRSLQEYLACVFISSLNFEGKASFYRETLSQKVFSSENSNYDWTYDFLERIDEYDFLVNFKMINLKELTKFISKHVKQRSDQVLLLSELITSASKSGLTFSDNYYRIYRYLGQNLQEYVLEIDDVYRAADFSMTFEQDHLPDPKLDRIIKYIANEMEKYEIDLDLKEALQEVSEVSDKVQRRIDSVKKSDKFILKYIK